MRPKMILIADIASNDESLVGEAASKTVQIANSKDGEGFIAVSPEARKRFWLDRARTAAIAKHTNAFKINEDVVIPLESLGEYSNGIDRINIELSINNKLKLIKEIYQYISDSPHDISKDDIDLNTLNTKKELAIDLLDKVQERWTSYLHNMDSSPHDFEKIPEFNGYYQTIFEAIQSHELRVSWKKELKSPLLEIFSGREYEEVSKKIIQIHKEILKSRVFIALHMHAGDGNIPTLIFPSKFR